MDRKAKGSGGPSDLLQVLVDVGGLSTIVTDNRGKDTLATEAII